MENETNAEQTTTSTEENQIIHDAQPDDQIIENSEPDNSDETGSEASTESDGQEEPTGVEKALKDTKAKLTKVEQELAEKRKLEKEQEIQNARHQEETRIKQIDAETKTRYSNILEQQKQLKKQDLSVIKNALDTQGIIQFKGQTIQVTELNYNEIQESILEHWAQEKVNLNASLNILDNQIKTEKLTKAQELKKKAFDNHIELKAKDKIAKTPEIKYLYDFLSTEAVEYDAALIDKSEDMLEKYYQDRFKRESGVSNLENQKNKLVNKTKSEMSTNSKTPKLGADIPKTWAEIDAKSKTPEGMKWYEKNETTIINGLKSGIIKR